MNLAMRNMYNELKKIGAYILIQIHDEVLVECPKEKQEEGLKIVRDCMEQAIVLPGVPLVSEPRVMLTREK